MKKSKKQLLFCPGPVNVHPRVKEAAAIEIGHREEEFSILLKNLNEKILEVFQIKFKNFYHPVFITGSGTAANETILSSVVHNKHILIISNGEFGERLCEISKIHNKNTHVLSFKWGEPIDTQQVANYLKKNHIDVIAMVHHETSTGMLNPIKKIGELTKKYNIIYIVDTVSSAGAEPVQMEKNNIAFCSTSTGKALRSLPGIGVIIGKKEEFAKLKNNPAKTAYLNLYKLYDYSASLLQTPNTPAVQLFAALEQALTHILQEGVTKRQKYIKHLATTIRRELKALNFSFLINEKHMSSVLTTVNLPQHLDMTTFRTSLLEKNIIIYNGKGILKDKVFQVANIGHLDEEHVSYFIQAIKETLSRVSSHPHDQQHDTISQRFLLHKPTFRLSFGLHAITNHSFPFRKQPLLKV